MASQKASFVLYFDSYPIFSMFSPDQRGELISALFDYARRICDTEESPEAATVRYPTLDGNTAVAFCCIAKDILRDTRKWKQRQQHCQQAAQERLRKQQTPQPAPLPTAPIRQDPPRAPAPEPRQWEPRPAAEPQRSRQPFVPKRNSNYQPRESREDEMARYVQAFHQRTLQRRQAQAAEENGDDFPPRLT